MNGLRTIEKLLRQTTARERFQALCIGLENNIDCDRLNKWSYSLTSLRWEAIYDFCHALLPLQHILRKYWNRSKYIAGMSGTKYQRLKLPNNSEGEQYGASPDGLESVISSDSFWAATAIVEHISYEAEFIGRWAEGCHCHGDVGFEWHTAQAASRGQEQNRRRNCNLRKKKFICPYKGCRAPELASADALVRLKSLMMQNRGLLTHAITRANSADQSAFLHDWVKARGRLWTLISFKLGYWFQLPWRLCCFAHVLVKFSGAVWQWQCRLQITM